MATNPNTTQVTQIKPEPIGGGVFVFRQNVASKLVYKFALLQIAKELVGPSGILF